MNAVQGFEMNWSRFIGTKYSIACNSGTSALHMALLAAGVSKGDEVIVPALSPVMPAFAVLYCGATPVFVDVDFQMFNIDRDVLVRKVTPKTKVIIVVHLYGLNYYGQHGPIKLGPIVIADSAECVLPNMGCGGDMIVHSFEASKHLSTGEGGMVSTNNEHYAELVRKYGGLGYKHLTADLGRTQADPDTFHDPNYKRHELVGYNYRMSPLCAEVGGRQLPTLDSTIRRRQAIALSYRQAIEGCEWLIPQKGSPNSYFTYAVTFERTDITWKQFYNRFKELSGGETFYAAWSLPWREPALAMYAGNCPVAESLQKKMMQFKTNYPTLREAEDMAEALRKTWRSFE